MVMMTASSPQGIASFVDPVTGMRIEPANTWPAYPTKPIERDGTYIFSELSEDAFAALDKDRHVCEACKKVTYPEVLDFRTVWDTTLDEEWEFTLCGKCLNVQTEQGRALRNATDAAIKRGDIKYMEAGAEERERVFTSFCDLPDCIVCQYNGRPDLAEPAAPPEPEDAEDGTVCCHRDGHTPTACCGCNWGTVGEFCKLGLSGEDELKELEDDEPAEEPIPAGADPLPEVHIKTLLHIAIMGIGGLGEELTTANKHLAHIARAIDPYGAFATTDAA